VLVDDQVRQRHGLAKLLGAAAQGRGHDRRYLLRHGSHRGALQPLRRASRACVRRRPTADRPALLHERPGAGLQTPPPLTPPLMLPCRSPFRAGALRIAGPCTLPVLPFVFAAADRPFLRRGLPMLLGMAATFAVVATLAAVGGGWAVAANQYGRYAAMAVLAL